MQTSNERRLQKGHPSILQLLLHARAIFLPVLDGDILPKLNVRFERSSNYKVQRFIKSLHAINIAFMTEICNKMHTTIYEMQFCFIVESPCGHKIFS